jgi:hypothetical protein
VRGAAHVGGVIVLGGSARIRDVLAPVYARMGFAWDPASVGAIEDEVGPLARETLVEALLAELAKAHALERAPLPHALLAEAGAREGEHSL